ncbi:GNAT family N-acetyltransferase [Tsukamurella asaccharolytica]|uniref:GNAT family N-acetyltransferase n=1 Tax=Tsukamurella asaccharolytica TaxID=2592067 RepID=A0A5C5RGM7_9ACTN|nr:GNAT family N-acetyltransferase [Tsukamurella asaccharolytica]TWS21205.1 GNAT family N-acetyltransferase [Tsukamurella asaccharolytica]
MSGPRPAVSPAPLDTLTDTLTAPVSLGAVAPGARVALAPDTQWLAVTGVSEQLIRSVDGASRFVSIRDGDSTVAAARATVTADAGGRLWGGLAAVTVAPSYRRRGLAHMLVRHAIAEAAGLGAARIYLEVTRDNDAAQSLYRSLGFTDHHTYGFWTEPDGTP